MLLLCALVAMNANSIVVDAASTTNRNVRTLRGITTNANTFAVDGNYVDTLLIDENAKFWERNLVGSITTGKGGKGPGDKKGGKKGSKKKGKGGKKGVKADIDRRVGSNDAGQHTKDDSLSPKTETIAPPS